MTAIGGNLAPALTSCVERIESLMSDKKAIQDDISEIFAEAREKELNTKVIREVIRIRKMNAAEREEEQHLRDVYLRALGLLEE